MTRQYRYEEIALNALGAADLREEAEAWDGETHAYHVTVFDETGTKQEPHKVEVLAIEDRVGFAWGADASWMFSTGNIERDIEIYLNDSEEFAARN